MGDKVLLVALESSGLEDMVTQFIPLHYCQWYKDERMWIMVKLRQEVKSQADYLLGTEQRCFPNVTILYLRHN